MYKYIASKLYIYDSVFKNNVVYKRLIKRTNIFRELLDFAKNL